MGDATRTGRDESDAVPYFLFQVYAVRRVWPARGRPPLCALHVIFGLEKPGVFEGPEDSAT